MFLLDLVVILLVVISGFKIVQIFKKEMLASEYKWLKILWLYHLIFGVIYYWYILKNGGDAFGYWSDLKFNSLYQLTSSNFFDKGTSFINVLNYIPVRWLNLSFFALSMIYTLVGFIGVLCFYMLTLKCVTYNIKMFGYHLFPLIYFLPNLHFWSAGVGKDSILFMCVGVFGYSMLNMSRKIPLILLTLFLSYMVRPHVALLLVAGYGVAYLLTSTLPVYKRLFLGLIFLGLFAVMLPYILEYVKLGDASAGSITEFSKNQAGNLADGGSGLDISSYPLIFKVFALLYRPLFFDINNALAIVASFENFFLLALTYRMFKSNPFRAFREAPLEIKGLFLFFLFSTLIFSISLGNLGIMLRMKNMFIPALLVFILFGFSLKKEGLVKSQMSI